ncbi:MAG TPA: hypothetical protein VF420_16430 [Casimicrobiaceae bacterium]
MRNLAKQRPWRTALWTGLLAALLMPASGAFAQSQAYQQLSAQWWQWIISIPVDVNPLLDTSGANCMVGQRGSDWFLAGTEGGDVERTCSIPEGTSLFFPVINQVNFDTPNACGQGPAPLPSSFYRALSKAFVDGATNLSVEVDGQALKHLQRVQSPIFEVAAPEDNLFVAGCLAFTGVTLPAGIYSPAVDDGYYVRLNPLAVGDHTLHIHAENPSAGFEVNVTYVLTVVPVVTH